MVGSGMLLTLGVFSAIGRSEEHTSELQSRSDLVCRLLLEKKKQEKHSQDKEKKEQTQQTSLKLSLSNYMRPILNNVTRM